jgi:hypothetical protein
MPSSPSPAPTSRRTHPARNEGVDERPPNDGFLDLSKTLTGPERDRQIVATIGAAEAHPAWQPLQ